MESKPRLSLRDARRLHGANGGKSAASSSSNPNARAYRIARQSGLLNLSTRSLQEFPKEILRLHELADEDERSWECAMLQKVDLSYNEIKELPTEIQEFVYVSSFKIRHNQLSQLPETFWNLTKLTSVDLSNNLLGGQLSESLGDLINLKELALDGNKLVQLPDSIHRLENLEVLKVENNQLRALPSSIGSLRRLHTLTAHSNQIPALPASLSQLANLSTLDLHKNSIVTVGDALVSLKALRFLDLHQNKLEVFPELPEKAALDQVLLGFNSLQAISDSSIMRVRDTITVLDVRDNRLRALPEKIAHLFRIKTLDLTNNDLNELPAGLGYLKDLHHLMVEGNPLRTIRRAVVSGGSEMLKKYLRTRGGPPVGVEALEEEFDEFALRDKQQQSELLLGATASAGSISSQHEYLFRDAASSGSLQLVGMGLMSLPPHLQGHGKFNFSATLVQLNLSKNKIGILPKEIGELAALQSLIAEECALTEIHPSISNLTQLQHLRLRKNLLKSEAIDAMISSTSQAGFCGSLKELDLGNNVLTTVPKKLTLLKCLDTLLMSFNRIQSLDGFPWASMQRLSILTLSDNQLESLGTVYDATMLTSLSLENNNLRQIPAELGRCENLRALLLAGNPQRSIRVNLIQEGTEAVLKYLRNRLPPELQSAPHAVPTVNDFAPSQDTENVPPSNQSATRARDAYNPMEKKRVRTNATQPSSSSAPAQHAATTPSTQVQADDSASANNQLLGDLNKKILALEGSLEDFALTAAKRFALKKELAMVRSQKIRFLRAIQP
ncbi:hypothetical protein Gpo141_00001719 [Globisporangium polare]